MKKVRFWVIRHGEKDGDADKLSEKGVEQVQKTARHLLKGMTFQAAFYSGMNRTKETVEIVLEELDQQCELQINEGFGFAWAEKEQPVTPEFRQLYKAATAGEKVTVAQCLSSWPGAQLIRSRLFDTMLGLARTLANRFPAEEEIDILVGSHGPAGELAAVKPEKTMALGLGSIICYVVEYNEQTGEIKLAHSVRLPG